MAKVEEVEFDDISPAGIAQYPALLKPDTKFDELGVYKVNLVLSETDAAPLMDKLKGMLADKLTELEDELNPEQLAKAQSNTHLPFSKEYEEDNKTPTGNIVFKFKTKAAFVSKRDGKVIEKKMTIVDSKKKRMYDVAVGGGSKIKVAFTMRTFYMAAIGAGVSARLGAVQVLELREYTDGNAASGMFGEEEGFEAEADVASGFDAPAAGAGVDL